jgi:hypothetical protein
MQLHAINKEEPAKEFMGGEKESAIKEREEKYLKSIFVQGMILSPRITTYTAFGRSPTFLSFFRSVSVKLGLAQPSALTFFTTVFSIGGREEQCLIRIQ